MRVMFYAFMYIDFALYKPKVSLPIDLIHSPIAIHLINQHQFPK